MYEILKILVFIKGQGCTLHLQSLNLFKPARLKITGQNVQFNCLHYSTAVPQHNKSGPYKVFLICCAHIVMANKTKPCYK